MSEERDLELRQRKKELRRRILQERDALDVFCRERAERALTERILGHKWFLEARIVLGFASYGGEIGTDGILEAAKDSGKKLYLPRVEGEELSFYRVDKLSELQTGYKGIREPAGDTERYVYDPAQEKVFVLLPGVAFDRERSRMGYGKGFYDRFLADKPKLLQRTVGVGFACQLVEEVPSGEWDIHPSEVICL